MNDERDGTDKQWAEVRQYFVLTWRYIRVVPVIFGVLFILGMIWYVTVTRVYTSIAVIGPPNPSPVSTLVGSLTGSSGSGGIARRIMGSSQGGTNDIFLEYIQLLSSTRLSMELIKKDNVLPVIFAKQWDSSSKSWRKPGWLLTAARFVLGRPAKDYPDTDSLKRFLERNMVVTEISTKKSSILSTSSSQGYTMVTLSFTDRETAMSLLSIILKRADDIIREEQMDDVMVRISILRSEIAKTDQLEQKQSLIQTLAGQEELRTMLLADNRYASILVDEAYAPREPTSPRSVLRLIFLIAASSIGIYLLVVGMGYRSVRLHRFLERFSSKDPAQIEG
jgi:hypothetical protein